MKPRNVAIELAGHTPILLDSGPFLMLPALQNFKEVAPDKHDPDDYGEVDRVTIKGFTRALPLQATVIGRTLHVTLPIPDFERLGSRIRSKREELIRLSFSVDEQGDATKLLLDGQDLARPRRLKHSYVAELGSSKTPKKSAV